jgi:hypothetical protein
MVEQIETLLPPVVALVDEAARHRRAATRDPI